MFEWDEIRSNALTQTQDNVELTVENLCFVTFLTSKKWHLTIGILIFKIIQTFLL